MIHHLLILLLVQLTQGGVSRDTSFTVWSAAESVLKKHPTARIVFPQHPKEIVSEENIVYTKIGERDLHLDIYRPKDSDLRPAVLFIHGGGWRSGDRSQNTPMAERFAERGYVAVSVEYRLSTEALYPAAVHDLKAAVRWLRAHSNERGVDTTRIAALGCSAGGQLAALLGTTNDNRIFEGEEGNAGSSSSVGAVVDVDGILDFTDKAESGKDTIPDHPSAGSYWFGGPMREKRALWIEASPLVHVDRNSAPIAFINSSIARFHAGRDSMIARLSLLGIYSEVHTIPDTPHPFWLFDPWFEPTCNDALEFLAKVFGPR